MPVKRILLWSCPRNVSSAFERSIRTLKAGHVIHEPFAVPYYYGPDKQNDCYLSDGPADTPQAATYQSVVRDINENFEGKEFVLVKEMAISAQNMFETFFQEDMKNFQHTFLIRNPAKSLHSLYKTSYFDPHLVGIKELFDLYEFVKNHIDPTPLVIDADDLLEFPDVMMCQYCAAVGIGYEEGMTSWEPGPVQGWDRPLCRGWHDSAMNSSGFNKLGNGVQSTQFQSIKSTEVQDLPQEVLYTIEKNMPYYEAMHKDRMLPPST